MQRGVDRKILWPACREHAPDLFQARRAMLAHMHLDGAYSEWTDLQKVEYVNSLT